MPSLVGPCRFTSKKRAFEVHLKTGESLDADSAGLMDVFGDQYVVQVAPGRLELRKWSGKRATNSSGLEQ